MNQRCGRVGDSAIIGAGTFADNASCAISCTGVGEHFLRTSLARQLRYSLNTVACVPTRPQMRLYVIS